MLPDVQAQNRRAAFHERAVLVRRAFYLQLAAVYREPGPARAETRGCRGAELLFEGIEAAEGTVNTIGHNTGRRSATARLHAGPEQ